MKGIWGVDLFRVAVELQPAKAGFVLLARVFTPTRRGIANPPADESAG